MSDEKAHYLAICMSYDGTYFISNTLYPDEFQAQADLGDCFVRILKEYAPVHLPPGKPREDSHTLKPSKAQAPVKPKPNTYPRKGYQK